jgi:16S rRNA (cytidine1402-2'-O)-methyltransferase
MPSTPSPNRDRALTRSHRYLIGGHAFEAKPLAPGLHVVATPIGHLKDISIRALETLAGADAVLAEDTRVSRKLLDAYGIETPLVSYHDHNAAEMRPRILGRLAAGEALAQISDAGTPLVSDPGFKLVRAVAEEGIFVSTVPGASAVLTGLVLAGLPTDAFFFAGFLPPKSGARRSRMGEVAQVPGTLVFFETGPRLAAMLADAEAVLGDRPAAVARELTKAFEEVRRGTLASLAAHYAEAGGPRGEIVVVIGPPPPAQAPDEADLDRLILQSLESLSMKDAAAEIAKETGMPRREVYARALVLAKGEDEA